MPSLAICISRFIVVVQCTDHGVLLYGQFLWPIKEVPHALFECMKYEKRCDRDTILIKKNISGLLYS
jgi:hypothetical protein